jgi:hypothetical protein
MITMLTMPAIIELNRLPKLGETDELKGDLPAVTFTMGKATWVLWEYDPKQRMGFWTLRPRHGGSLNSDM